MIHLLITPTKHLPRHHTTCLHHAQQAEQIRQGAAELECVTDLLEQPPEAQDVDPAADILEFEEQALELLLELVH